ncbi:hypothetical protein K491DRAFT_689284 [Lophiostoma macrostomum CBS 122681]|uniref:Uncharacterized protein n=1 Tax=Lophiostoma macrostomum CBS 122681 TaxID=1314788 RepID=A0A6A6TI66_9PLEO|nr:hypothetical protein K491DRAFT_689284 [Lophiostoma macrostomum CBS 122681]
MKLSSSRTPPRNVTEASSNRKRSFDITDYMSSSPAPTYSSSLHSDKDHVSPLHISKSSPKTQSILWEDFWKEASKAAMADSKNPAITITKKRPSPPLPIYGPPIPPAKRRMPRLAILIPWLLATLFFLTTLWFTSVALFYNTRHPSTTNDYTPEINVYIDGLGATPSIKISTIPAATPTPTHTTTAPPTSSSAANDNQGGQFITKRAAEPHNAANDLAPAAPVVTAAPQTTLVPEMKRHAEPSSPLKKKDANAEPEASKHNHCGGRFYCKKRAETRSLEQRAAISEAEPAPEPELIEEKRDAEAEASRYNHCGGHFNCKRRAPQVVP